MVPNYSYWKFVRGCALSTIFCLIADFPKNASKKDKDRTIRNVTMISIDHHSPNVQLSCANVRFNCFIHLWCNRKSLENILWKMAFIIFKFKRTKWRSIILDFCNPNLNTSFLRGKTHVDDISIQMNRLNGSSFWNMKQKSHNFVFKDNFASRFLQIATVLPLTLLFLQIRRFKSRCNPYAKHCHQNMFILWKI